MLISESASAEIRPAGFLGKRAVSFLHSPAQCPALQHTKCNGLNCSKGRATRNTNPPRAHNAWTKSLVQQLRRLLSRHWGRRIRNRGVCWLGISRKCLEATTFHLGQNQVWCPFARRERKEIRLVGRLGIGGVAKDSPYEPFPCIFGALKKFLSSGTGRRNAGPSNPPTPRLWSQVSRRRFSHTPALPRQFFNRVEDGN